MGEIILDAIERTGPTGNFKEAGFVPGVMYGDGIAVSASVKFEEPALKKVLGHHGANAKVWVMYGGKKKFGFIKEIQRHPVSGNLMHVDVQIVSKEHEIKLQIPFVFSGEALLKERQLQLQVYKPDITVTGKMALLPESIAVDLSDKNLGDTITLQDFKLDSHLKTGDNDDTIYGVIIHLRAPVTEEEPVAAAE